MAIITFVNSDIQHHDDGVSETITPSLPAHQADDYFVALVGRSAQSFNAGAWTETAAGGWTLVDEFLDTGGGDRRVGVFVKRATSGSETNPTFDSNVGGSSRPMTAIVLVFRVVDTIGDGLDVAFTTSHRSSVINTTLPTNPDITTVTDDAWVILWQFANINDMSMAGAPTNYTIRENGIGSSFTDSQSVAATREISSAGLQTLTAWTHTSSPTDQQDNTLYTLALRPASGFNDAVVSEDVGTDDITVPISLDTHDDANTDHSDLFRSISSPASGGSVIQNDIMPIQGDLITDDVANSTSAPSPDTSYFYMLRDYEDAGELAPHDSNELSLKTAPARPTSITLLQALVQGVKVGWTDQTADTHKHLVFYRLKGDSSWIPVVPTGVPAGTDEYTVGNLLPGVYEFHVRAWDGASLKSGFTEILEAATATELRAFQCSTFQYDAFQVREPSFVSPSADVAVGNWTDELSGASGIFGSINEDPAVDTDYVTTLVVATDDIYRFRLEPIGDRPCDQGFVLQYRIEREGAGTVRMIFDIIKEDLTVIVTKTHASVADAIIEDKIELTSTQVATLRAANWFANPLVQVTADNGT